MVMTAIDVSSATKTPPRNSHHACSTGPPPPAIGSPPTNGADSSGISEGLRNLMRRHPAGVVVITTSVDRPTGFCATSFSSVSLDPPTVSFAVSIHSASGAAWATTSYGIVHILGAEHREVARQFARSGPEKFATGWRSGPAGQPLLNGIHTWLLIAPAVRLVVGDHLVVIAEVVESNCLSASEPLLYHNGTFYSLPL